MAKKKLKPIPSMGMSGVFKSVMRDLGLNKGEQQKADRDKKIKEGTK